MRSIAGCWLPRNRTRDRPQPPEPDAPEPNAAHAPGASLWGDEAAPGDASADGALDPTTLFHRARTALEAGRTAEAATGLILALRASPVLAPATLDLLAGRNEPILALVRGDAQRVVGREVEAMRDHAAAAGGLADGPATTDDLAHPAEPAPGATDAEDAERDAWVDAQAALELDPNALPPTPVQEDP